MAHVPIIRVRGSRNDIVMRMKGAGGRNNNITDLGGVDFGEQKNCSRLDAPEPRCSRTYNIIIYRRCTTRVTRIVVDKLYIQGVLYRQQFLK